MLSWLQKTEVQHSNGCTVDEASVAPFSFFTKKLDKQAILWYHESRMKIISGGALCSPLFFGVDKSTCLCYHNIKNSMTPMKNSEIGGDAVSWSGSFLMPIQPRNKKWFWGWQTRNLWYNNNEVGRMICRRLTISPEIRSWGVIFLKSLDKPPFCGIIDHRQGKTCTRQGSF